jgi:hypothetical protein
MYINGYSTLQQDFAGHSNQSIDLVSNTAVFANL